MCQLKVAQKEVALRPTSLHSLWGLTDGSAALEMQDARGPALEREAILLHLAAAEGRMDATSAQMDVQQVCAIKSKHSLRLCIAEDNIQRACISTVHSTSTPPALGTPYKHNGHLHVAA